MVEPVGGDRRRDAIRRLAVGFVLLVAVSAAGSAAYGGASVPAVGVAGAAGLLTGVLLLGVLGIRP